MPGPNQKSPQGWPQEVGIVATEIYFPSQYVDQSELEAFDGVSSGKYTIGLGQGKMGFCSDREDIQSLCLTVTRNLLRNNNIDPAMVGRLEVGTETIIDKSKSVKSALMQLFEKSGNTDIEGIDTTNACYGGTSALLNSINWVESSSWDGRYAVVVCGDIAVYATGPARCTGGAGAIAILVGPNAALVMDRGVRSTHMQHVYDFYKPDLQSEYPVVDGKLSIQCYLGALDKCYERYRAKAATSFQPGSSFCLEDADAFCFHTPFCKLVQKSVGRLMFNDFLSNADDPRYSDLAAFRDIKLEDSYFNRDVEKTFLTASKDLYEEKTKPSLKVANQVGNMYTPSVYASLCSYLSGKSGSELTGKRIVMFSYGSGLASTMFSLKASDDYALDSPLDRLAKSLFNLQERLNSRQKVDPAIFSDTMKLREDTHHLAPYTPVGSVDILFPGTWYLTAIDDKHRREYDVVPDAAAATPDSPVHEPASKKLAAAPPVACGDNSMVTA